MVRLYRRELQRNYVMLLLIAMGAASDPQVHSDAPQSEQPGAIANPLRRQNAARSGCRHRWPKLQLQYREAKKRPSEFRAALRDGLAYLSAKIDRALKRVKDPRTASHLRDLDAELREGVWSAGGAAKRPEL